MGSSLKLASVDAEASLKYGAPDHAARLLFEIDQDHVARLRATRERELFAVARDGEPKNVLRSEVGQLFRRHATNGLRPEVRNATARENVNNRAAVCGPGQVRPELPCQGKCLDGWPTL